MNLSNAKLLLSSDVDEFFAMWIEKNKEDPESYVLDLSESEWYEQFTTWLEFNK